MPPKKPPKTNESQSAARRSVRTFTNWTYSRLRSAERSADSGNLSDAAMICEWLLGDDAIAGAIDARVDGLLGLQPTFEASGDKRRSSRAVKALEAGDDFWRTYPESELRQLITWRLLLGVAPARHDWTDALPEHDGRILPLIEFWHPSGIRYDFQRAGWFGRDSTGEFPIVAGDSTWVLHSISRHRPWSLGLWRQLGRWVLFRHLAVGDYSRHSEKGAMIVATSERENTDAQRKKLADDLANSGADAAIVLQSGFKLDFLEVTANTKQIYEAQVELANRAIATRIRGGNLTTNVEGGSKAAADTQYRAGELPKLKADGEALSTTLHDQSLIWWAEFNFGDRSLAPWPVYPTEPEEDKKVKAETAKTAFEGAQIADKLGFEIDVKGFRETYGLEYISGRASPEDIAKRNAASAPPASEPPPNDQKEPTKKAILRGPVALLSGASGAGTSGFIDGQLYVDEVTDTSAAHAEKELEPTLEAILEELEAAKDYEDLRERLRARYETLDAKGLTELVSRSLIVADLAGRHAVNQDAK